MDSQLFLIINIALGFLFLLWFLSGRRAKNLNPTTLNMKASSRPNSAVSTYKSVSTYKPRTTPPPPPSSPAAAKSSKEDYSISQAKNLSVLFIYNGHDWEAYEVLGLPAGASLPMVTERYQKLIINADKGQIEFYEAAYSAILKKF